MAPRDSEDHSVASSSTHNKNGGNHTLVSRPSPSWRSTSTSQNHSSPLLPTTSTTTTTTDKPLEDNTSSSASIASSFFGGGKLTTPLLSSRFDPATILQLKRPGGTSSIAAGVFNLTKQIVGAGALGLPAGIASIGCNHPSALIPVALLICTIGTISAYGFCLLGRICHFTQAQSYRQAWQRTVGDSSSWMPAWACVLVAVSSAITYNIVLAETLPDLLHPLLGVMVPKSTALLTVTTFCLLPLCLMKELSSLAPYSLVGILAMVYTALVMMERYSSGAYSTEAHTATQPAILQELSRDQRPSFGTLGWQAVLTNPHCTIVISMLSTSFMAHYNAPKYYWELQNNTLNRYDTVVAASFFGSMLLLSTIAFLGFATFGAHSQGLILNNYAVSDTLMTWSRAAVAISIMFSYPLSFVGIQDGLFDLLQISSRQRQATGEVVTVVLLATIAGAALWIQDIRIIMAFSGASWGNCVIYIFPSYMMLKGVSKYPEMAPHLVPATLTACMGVLLGCIGGWQALQNLWAFVQTFSFAL